MEAKYKILRWNIFGQSNSNLELVGTHKKKMGHDVKKNMFTVLRQSIPKNEKEPVSSSIPLVTMFK